MSFAPRPTSHLSILALACALTGACGGDTAVDSDATPGRLADAAALTGDARPNDAAQADAAGPPDGLSADAGDPMLLSDDFDGTTLDSAWLRLRPELLDLTVAGGQLHLSPNQRALWFNDNQGPLVYRELTGDFRVTARVHARLDSDANTEPSLDFHLGGLMARAPAAIGGSENYVAILVGRDDDGITVETKNTTNSITQWEGPDWPTADAQIRICRVGQSFTTYKRAIGESTWIEASNPTRTDLPGTLQVGAVAYAPTDSPDHRASFEELHFAPIVSAGDCLN